MTSRISVSFDAAAKHWIAQLGLVSGAPPTQVLPRGVLPAPGDLWADDRYAKGALFVVTKRSFHWDAEGACHTELELGLSARPGPTR